MVLARRRSNLSRKGWSDGGVRRGDYDSANCYLASALLRSVSMLAFKGTAGAGAGGVANGKVVP